MLSSQLMANCYRDVSIVADTSGLVHMRTRIHRTFTLHPFVKVVCTLHLRRVHFTFVKQDGSRCNSVYWL